jgi:nitric oxide reductase NorD protein
MAEKDPRLESIDRELAQFPVAVFQQYHTASEKVSTLLSAEDLISWADQGAAIARQSVRSWESATEYFSASMDVLPFLSFANFTPWAQNGLDLCQASPTIAAAYFRASATTLTHLRPRQVAGWSELGKSLSKGTWKSTALSCKFFEISPQLIPAMTFPELERFIRFIDILSQRSYDLATECLELSQSVFPNLGDSRDSFISLVTTLADANGNWREVKDCFEVGARVVTRIERSQRSRFLALAERLSRSGEGGVIAFLRDGSQGVGELDQSAHPVVLTLAEALISLSPAALAPFLTVVPTVLARISPPQLELWFAEGIRLLSENQDSGLAFFRMESSFSEEMLDKLSAGVELSRVKEVVGLYSRALAGNEMEIAPAQELVDKGIGWVSGNHATIEGNTLYLPALIDGAPTKEENFAKLKVIATHQVAHQEFESFGFRYENPATLFRNLRPLVMKPKSLSNAPPEEAVDAAPAPEGEPAPDDTGPVSVETGWVTDMQGFFDIFPERRMALDIFTVTEDSRLDARVVREYRGIKKAYQQVQANSLAERPPIEEMPAQQGLVEFLIRLSLGQREKLPVASYLADEARRMSRIVLRVMRVGSAVEDAAEAALRIYVFIAGVPNHAIPANEWTHIEIPEDDEYEDPENMEELLKRLDRKPEDEEQEQEQESSEGEGEESYESPQDVEYRGEFKPELVQLLEEMKEAQRQANDGEPPQLTREMLEELLAQSAELEQGGDADMDASTTAKNLMREVGMKLPPKESAQGQGPFVHVDDEGGPLDAAEPHTSVYDEWDFRAGDYRPRWCVVREKVMAEGDVGFWDSILHTNANMIAEIRRQFEQVRPETFRKIRRLSDGEEFDFDALVEAMIDMRLGLSLPDRVYWRRNKMDRDVAVLFLLDMSASTGEAIDESRGGADEWDAPANPVDYMLWLRNRRGTEGAPRRTYKRIIDLEKEASILLIQALEALGDKYGIYGFSGYGRENVEYYTIKDINESMSDKVQKRIDKITPLHATRMGPAIRHSIKKLDEIDAKTKVLFLISDGRPQDRGYSREGVEKEYAVHDTRKALLEGKQKGIIPFCLTVDKAGHDYLKTMMGDMGYEILSDISMLPQRLPELYKRLTV